MACLNRFLQGLQYVLADRKGTRKSKLSQIRRKGGTYSIRRCLPRCDVELAREARANVPASLVFGWVLGLN